MSGCIAHLFISCSSATAQQRISDTGRSSPLRIDLKNSSIGVRVGAGVQGSFCYEAGLARNSFAGSPHGLVGSSLYAVFASFPAFRRTEMTASGFRAGADFYGNGVFLGIETSAFWADGQQDVLIAPKIGLGIPELSAFYAYHFSTNEWAVARIGRHALGLQCSPHIWYHNKLKGTKHWFWQPKPRNPK